MSITPRVTDPDWHGHAVGTSASLRGLTLQRRARRSGLPNKMLNALKRCCYWHLCRINIQTSFFSSPNSPKHAYISKQSYYFANSHRAGKNALNLNGLVYRFTANLRLVLRWPRCEVYIYLWSQSLKCMYKCAPIQSMLKSKCRSHYSYRFMPFNPWCLWTNCQDCTLKNSPWHRPTYSLMLSGVICVPLLASISRAREKRAAFWNINVQCIGPQKKSPNRVSIPLPMAFLKC